MAAEGAEVSLLVPRLYSPAWLNWLLKRPPSINHRSALLIPDQIEARGCLYFARPGRTFKRRAGGAMYGAIRSQAIRMHGEKPFDIVYGTDWFLGCEVARRLGLNLAVPAAGLAIGDDVNVTARQSIENERHFRRIARELDATLACGDSLAGTIDSERERKTLSVYGVVDLERFAPADAESKELCRRQLKLPLQDKIILYVGYLQRRKGLLELVEAFEAIDDRGTHLVLCGTGDDEKLIRDRVHASSASPRVHFMGDVAPNSIASFMQASDLFVLPSYSEGMPNAVMEAMACGLPVICTTVGGIPRALDAAEDAYGPSEVAFLIPPRDTAALETALRNLLLDPSLAAQMQVRARSLAERKFGARPNARRILHHFQEAIAAYPSLRASS